MMHLTALNLSMKVLIIMKKRTSNNDLKALVLILADYRFTIKALISV